MYYFLFYLLKEFYFPFVLEISVFFLIIQNIFFAHDFSFFKENREGDLIIYCQEYSCFLAILLYLFYGKCFSLPFRESKAVFSFLCFLYLEMCRSSLLILSCESSYFSLSLGLFPSFAIPHPSSYSAILHFVRPGRDMTLKIKFFPKFLFN